MSIVTNWLQAVGRLASNRYTSQTYASAWLDRRASYELNEAYYANRVYETIANGGQRDYINTALGNAAAADLSGLYNPVASIVDLYLNVFAGAFGDEIVVQPEDKAGQGLVEAIEQLWRWSNINIEKQPLCRLPALNGLAGIRIVGKDDPDITRRRVYLKVEHPSIIRDVEEDDRGNVTAIQLEYDETSGIGDNAQTVTTREEMTKDEFRIYRVEHGNARLIETRPNALGVVPYVLARHNYTGDTWGSNAFYRARPALDRLNALLSHIDIQIHRHVKAKWLLAASGKAPAEIDLSDMTVVYVDTSTSGNGSTPVMQAMVANLDLSGALKQAEMQIGIIEDMQPELKATQGKFLSGQSGETIAELRKPAEDSLLLARSNIEDAVIRAQQIAVSQGIVLGIWDVGTGKGDREAADRAFHEGYENHRFNKRPAFSERMAAAVPGNQPAPVVEDVQPALVLPE